MRKLAQELEGTGQAEWAGVGYVQIDGSTDQRDRRDACQRFKNDPSIRVALLSVMAAGKRHLCSCAPIVAGASAWPCI